MNKISLESIELETERCFLRPLSPYDEHDVKALYLDPVVRQFLGGVVKEENFPEKWSQIINNPSPYQWIARRKDNDTFIGLFSLDAYHDTDEIELSYQVAKAMQGQGLAHEICKKIIDFGLKDIELTKIVSETQSANFQSIKLLEKLGMSLVQTLERYGNIQAVYQIIKVG